MTEKKEKMEKENIYNWNEKKFEETSLIRKKERKKTIIRGKKKNWRKHLWLKKKKEKLKKTSIVEKKEKRKNENNYE